MEKNRKFPDLVVWDEQRGFYAKTLTYGSDLSAPTIKLEDVKGWRQREVTNVNKLFDTKYKELKKEIEKLYEEYNWNELIYGFVDYSFIPNFGEIYYLYRRQNGDLFLSLIEPNQWSQELIGSFRMESNNKWVKL